MTGIVFLGASEYSVGERDGFVTVTFKRTGDTSGAVTVNYATNPGTATEGIDYPDNDGIAVIPAGAESITVNLPINNDALSESTETFSLSIVSISSGTLLFPRTANISILDDETPAPELPQPPLTSPYTVSTTSIVTGLVEPMTIEWIPGEGTLAFVAEKAGRIKVVDTATGTQTVMLDIRGEVNSNADRGLMDIALHPDFANHPYLYAFYVVEPPGSTAPGESEGNRYAHVVRWEVNMSGATPTIVAGSKTIMLGGAGQSFADISGNGLLNFTEEQYANNRASDIDPVTGLYKEDYIKVDSQSHAGGALAFGPDGALYVSTGDGSSFDYADPRSAGVQSIDSLSGKILRIDPITGNGYANNPFAEANLDTNQSKVWSLGLRNPYSMTFTEDGRLFISETGWYTWEEINVGARGANFGWPYYEGGDDGVLVRTPGYQTQPGASAFYTQVTNGQIVITPAYRAFSHVDSAPGYQVSAIVGASTIYTGNKYPAAFLNDYFFTDIVDGEIFTVDIHDRTKLQFLTDVGAYGPVNFVQSPDGYIYILDVMNGRIARLNITDPNPPANAPPTVANPIADRSTAEDAPFSYVVPVNTFADTDDATLAFSASLAGGGALPAWLTFNAATRTFSGTPDNGAVGTLQVMVTATDPKGASVSDVFALTITNVNDAPVVSQPIAQQAAVPATAFSYTLPVATFSDPDGDALTLVAQLANGGALPSWLSFNAATRTFSGTPTAGNVGTLVIAVKATDPSGASVTDYFTINVAQGNAVPVVANPIDAQNATTGATFAFTLPAGTFTDDGALTLSAKLASGASLPAWLSFNAATGAFTGTPPSGSAGKVVVSVTATDAQGLSVSDSFAITIAQGTGGGNAPPVVANLIPDQTVAEESALNFVLPANTFSDPNGDALTRSATLVGGAALPAWLTFNPATGAFTGTPNDPQVGTIAIRVTARDPSGATVSDDFNLTVTPVNDAPTVANPIADRNATTGVALNFALPANTFADVDSPTLTLSATLQGGGALPTWLTFNAATATFSGTPGAANLGAANIVVTATDGGGRSVSDTFVVNVAAAPAGEVLYQNTAANQTITATSANDVFVLGAVSTGYQWGPTTDGTGIVIWNAAGFDILFGFETLRFTNQSVNIATQNGPVYQDVPEAVQHLTGRTANDIFVIAGLSSAYAWGPTASGTGVVVWTVSPTDNTYDVLTGFESLQFSDRTVSIGTAPTGTATVSFAPTIASKGSEPTATIWVAEATSEVVQLTAVDIDGPTLRYSIVGGADRAAFTCTAAGSVKFAALPNFERAGDADGNNAYRLVVQVSDGTHTDRQTITVRVANTDRAINGDEGANTLVGTAADESINGGRGRDTLTGGAGEDAFVFNVKLGPENADHITNFAANDTIELGHNIFRALPQIGLPQALAASEFRIGAKARDADDHILYARATGALYYDPDGNGAAAKVIFAILDNRPALTAADFLIV